MPRFSVNFGRRKSTADNLENAPVTTPSFRVLERSEVVASKQFDGSYRPAPVTSVHQSRGSDASADDNIFADLKPNRGSGSSNTTKTTLTDNSSSRNSNVSTAPSSADTGASEEWRGTQKKAVTDIPVPPVPKPSGVGFLRSAGRTFSFGGQKKNLPPTPTIEESPPSTPAGKGQGRPRATTSSTTTTATPPRLDQDFDLDLGGDFGKLVLGNDKRASTATVKIEQSSGQMPVPRSLTGARPAQPTPIHIDKAAKVDPPAHSWSSNHSNDRLITSTSPSPSPALKDAPDTPVPRATSPLLDKQSGASPEVGPRRPLLADSKGPGEDGEDEEARLLRDSLSTVSKFMNGTGPSSSTSRYRRSDGNDEGDGESLFDASPAGPSRYGERYVARKPNPPPTSNKVMTPAEFEKYRRDKERQDRERQITSSFGPKAGDNEDDEDNYEDDEDEAEKARQQAKQRRKQEAHMAVYRQQMMKVTGESSGSTASPRPSLQMSLSTPNLPNMSSASGSAATGGSGDSDEDEEIPLAILAAHGFPNKNRPPNRLSTMGSNPNLRASVMPSYQRPVSMVAGDGAGAGNPRLPAFARNLPKDPFVGAGLVRNPVRESFALGGGAATPMNPAGGVPPGGLIGVIANEERNRALRRGSPHLEGPNQMPGSGSFDPIGGIPAHMMYQGNTLSPGDQAQIQMTQQMQQFMQMQMQFMQMMAGQNGNAPAMSGGLLTSPSVGSLSGMGQMRHSFMANDSMNFGRGEAQMRTMSMVQPSSASWIQPTPGAGYAPSVRLGAGYAPSIAPSERSTIGLPGRYRPVSHMPPPSDTGSLRKSMTMPSVSQPSISVTKANNDEDDDDEEGWEAMKAKREKKKSMWRAKKSLGDSLGSFLN